MGSPCTEAAPSSAATPTETAILDVLMARLQPPAPASREADLDLDLVLHAHPEVLRARDPVLQDAHGEARLDAQGGAIRRTCARPGTGRPVP